MKRALVATAFASMMLVGGSSPALAQPKQDGLVNVNVANNNVLNNVSVIVAARAAAQICGLKVGPVAALARQVDRSGEDQNGLRG